MRILQLVNWPTYYVQHVDSSFRTEDADYDPGPYKVIFPAEQTTIEFNVSIIDDNVLENDEQFNLMIDGGALPDDIMLGDPHTTVVTIVNDDGKCNMELQFIALL